MRTVFDQLVAEGEAGIDRLVAERAQETVQLDFKLKHDPTRGQFDQQDKKVFGKALSAFANSGGGTLVWGVDGRKVDDIDCAQGATPITGLAQFASEATRLSAELLIPRHDGIEIVPIPSTAAPDIGYLLVHVERSERRPHRCERQGDKHYYKRAGDSSFMMEHYDIEDAFRRSSVPTLAAGRRFQITASDGAGHWLGGSLQLFLENTSNVTAKMPYLQIYDATGAAQRTRPLPNIIRHQEDAWTTFSGDMSVAIHPGMKRTMAEFQIDFEWHGTNAHIQGSASHFWQFHADCRFGCENLQASAVIMDLREGDLFRMVGGE